jgi:hypothetical protein
MKKYIPLIAALLCLPLLCGCEAKQIKAEIIEYVLQNKDSIEIDTEENYKEFFYKGTGDITASVDYGYYYTKDNDYHLKVGAVREYSDGYRVDGIGNDPTDWYYTEKICDNWYYYELHDG